MITLLVLGILGLVFVALVSKSISDTAKNVDRLTAWLRSKHKR
jgi:hypothetical protein